MVKTHHLLMLLLLAGCVSADGPLRRDGILGQASRGSSERFQGEVLTSYFRVLESLNSADTADQAALLRRLEDEHEAAPNTTNTLTLAIAQSLPGHQGSNPDIAGELLRQLLADRTLLPEERVLAELVLRHTEQAQVLREQLARVSSVTLAEVQSANARREAETRELLEENALLRQQLLENQRILEELTNIERSIRERENGN